jgi:hypothetical protein
MSKPGWRERSRENRTRKRLLDVLNRAMDSIAPLLESEDPQIRLQAVSRLLGVVTRLKSLERREGESEPTANSAVAAEPEVDAELMAELRRRGLLSTPDDTLQ